VRSRTAFNRSSSVERAMSITTSTPNLFAAARRTSGPTGPAPWMTIVSPKRTWRRHIPLGWKYWATRLRLGKIVTSPLI